MMTSSWKMLQPSLSNNNLGQGLISRQPRPLFSNSLGQGLISRQPRLLLPLFNLPPPSSSQRPKRKLRRVSQEFFWLHSNGQGGSLPEGALVVLERW